MKTFVKTYRLMVTMVLCGIIVSPILFANGTIHNNTTVNTTQT